MAEDDRDDDSEAKTSSARRSRDADASTNGAIDEEANLPFSVKFLCELRGELRAESLAVGSHFWRETDIVSSLIRQMKGSRPGKVGRVFTAANERGCAVLVGEEMQDFEDVVEMDNISEQLKPRGCRVAMSTLEREVNLGAVDGRNTKVVLLVTLPQSLHPRGALETMNRLEAMKTIKVGFLKLIRETDFVRDARRAKSCPELMEAYIEACSVLTGEHLRQVEERAEIAARQGAEFTGKFAGGIVNDIKRRWAVYKSDWVDGLRAPMTCLSATLYMYFACLGPAIAFGGLAYKETAGQVGAMEYLCSQALSGILWAVFSGQPEIVLRPAGPQTVFLIELYKRCKSWKLDFLVTSAWVGLWTSIFMLVIAVSDACAFLVNKCTKFTQDIFSLFVCAIFIFEGVKNLIEYISDDNFSTEQALFSLILGMLTLQLGLWAVQVRSSPYLNMTVRELTADFGLASAVIIASVTAKLSKISGLDHLILSDSFEPSVKRDWWIDLGSGDKFIPLIAIFPAIMLTILYYIDMNVASLLCNAPSMKMRKGAAYHYNFAILAILVCITSLLGLPPPTGSLPHSPQYVLALSDVEEYTVDGEARRKIIKVHEQRLSPLLVNVLVALSFVVVPALKSIPMSVLFGLFIYTGIMGLYENHFWERIKIAFMEPRLHPPTSYVRHVPLSRVHAFTLVQIVCVGVLWGIRSSPIALTFPIFILALMPIRILLFKKFNMFSAEWLELLDAKGGPPRKTDEDNQIMEDRKENKWLLNARTRNVSFLEFSQLHESGPAFGNAASLHAHSVSHTDIGEMRPLTPIPQQKRRAR